MYIYLFTGIKVHHAYFYDLDDLLHLQMDIRRFLCITCW